MFDCPGELEASGCRVLESVFPFVFAARPMKDKSLSFTSRGQRVDYAKPSPWLYIAHIHGKTRGLSSVHPRSDTQSRLSLRHHRSRRWCGEPKRVVKSKSLSPPDPLCFVSTFPQPAAQLNGSHKPQRHGHFTSATRTPLLCASPCRPRLTAFSACHSILFSPTTIPKLTSVGLAR